MSTKTGARNSVNGREHVRAILRKAAREIDAISVELEPDDDDAPAKAGGAAEGATVAVKAVGEDGGEWVLDVLGNPYGGPNNGRDTDGEYFSPNTRFHEQRYALPPVVFYHGYDPDSGKPSGEPAYIGKTLRREVKPDGVWYRVVLDKASAYARRVWEAAKQGVAKASSGSNHLARVDKDGHIREWPVTELSIFDAVGRRQPANAYAVALPAMKAVYAAAGLPLPVDILTPQAKATGAPDTYGGQRADATGETENPEGLPEITTMEINEQVAQAVDAALKARDADAARLKEADDARKQTVDDAVKAARAEWEKENASSLRLPDGAPAVRQFANLDKYDNIDTDDLSFAVGLLHAAKVKARSEHGASRDAVKALAVRFAESTADAHAPVKSAMRSQGLPVKANEINHSTNTNAGDEWIGVAYSNSLWQRVRETSNIVSRIPTIEVPHGVESVVIPLESTSPTFYKVVQGTAQDTNTLGKATYTHPSSKMATALSTLSVGKLGARVLFSGELEEDSVLPWAAELRRQLELEAGEVLESLVIDGDTATGATTNINHIGGTPGGAEYFLVMDGFRKLALVTNTANSRSAGTFDEADFLETVKLMGLGGKNAVNKAAVSFIVDPHTHWAALAIPALKTRDVFAQPTIERGMLVNIYGYDVIATPNMHRANQDATYGLKANSAGKCDLTTAANNTYGALLAVRFDQWRLGWARRIKFEVDRVPQADVTEIVCNMRVGMVYRDTEASAISYGVSLA